MSDRIFFESDNLLVTNSRFQVGNETYIIRNITSVKVNIIPGKKGTPAIVVDPKSHKRDKLVVAFILIILGLLTVVILIGYMLIWAGIVGLFDNTPPKDIPAIPDEPDTHELILKTAGGEIKAFATQDKILIDNLVKALNEAFDYGG